MHTEAAMVHVWPESRSEAVNALRQIKHDIEISTLLRQVMLYVALEVANSVLGDTFSLFQYLHLVSFFLFSTLLVERSINQ